MTSAEQILYVIALATTQGADAALSEAIELGLISHDQHILSEDWADALAATEEV